MYFFNDSIAYGQELRDTLTINESTLETDVKYSAKDSIVIDAKDKILHLYGEAQVFYEGIDLKAGYIQINLKDNELSASYIYDKDSLPIQHPVFKDGNEEIIASKLRYNTNTQKAYIEAVKIKQDEMYLHMEVGKRQKNGEIHFKLGRFTTCDLDEPHYHFQLSRAIMIPEKRIVSGPMNLFIKGVPTPLGLPFSVIPQSKTRKKGLLFPEIVPYSQFGFGVQNLGYYIPINNSLQNISYLTLYNRGSFEIKNEIEYLKKYQSSGKFGVSFQYLKKGFPSKEAAKAFKINWRHKKDPKSNPNFGFSANVNFNSQNNPKNSIDPNNAQYLNNILKSDINFSRRFGKVITTGVKLSMEQNNASGLINLKSPVLNVNSSRFYPLKFIGNQTKFQKAISKTNVTYSLEGNNQSRFSDSLLRTGDFNAIQNEFTNGVQQKMLIQNTFGLLKNTVKLTPSLNYSNALNLQQTRKEYNSLTDEVESTIIQQAGASNNLSFSANMVTSVYSYYAFVGKKKPLLRHIATPSIGYSFIPKLNNEITYYAGPNLGYTSYSAFENSMYKTSSSRASSLITFGLNNTFELKRLKDIDSTANFTKTKIIEGLSFTGNYNLIKDSMKLSDIRINLRLAPLKDLKMVISSTFSPYSWDEKGKATKHYAIDSMSQLGRFTKTAFNTTYTIASKESKEKLEEIKDNIGNNWNADYDYFYLHPEQIISFDIPWKISFTHIYSIRANQNISETNSDKLFFTHTLNTNGDLSLTKRWKVSANLNFDIENQQFTYSSINLNRDMHCWALSFNWIPLGANKSFVLSIRNTSSLLKDAKFDMRKPPLFF